MPKLKTRNTKNSWSLWSQSIW